MVFVLVVGDRERGGDSGEAVPSRTRRLDGPSPEEKAVQPGGPCGRSSAPTSPGRGRCVLMQMRCQLQGQLQVGENPVCSGRPAAGISGRNQQAAAFRAVAFWAVLLFSPVGTDAPGATAGPA
jgi:hypothetical protein